MRDSQLYLRRLGTYFLFLNQEGEHELLTRYRYLLEVRLVLYGRLVKALARDVVRVSQRNEGRETWAGARADLC